MIASVDIRLSAVADLTSVDQQKRLMTNAQELTGDWAGHSLRALHSPVPEPRNCPAPTQELGLALHADPRIEGFVTVSARMPTHRNLIVFPGKLRATSSISFRHPETDDILTIP